MFKIVYENFIKEKFGCKEKSCYKAENKYFDIFDFHEKATIKNNILLDKKTIIIERIVLLGTITDLSTNLSKNLLKVY